jgi:hypothetical protein
LGKEWSIKEGTSYGRERDIGTEERREGTILMRQRRKMRRRMNDDGTDK